MLHANNLYFVNLYTNLQALFVVEEQTTMVAQNNYMM